MSSSESAAKIKENTLLHYYCMMMYCRKKIGRGVLVVTAVIMGSENASNPVKDMRYLCVYMSIVSTTQTILKTSRRIISLILLSSS